MPFVLLSGELDCNRCIAKQTKIVKMIGEFVSDDNSSYLPPRC